LRRKKLRVRRFRSSGVQEFRSSGVQEFKSSRVQERPDNGEASFVKCAQG
jgi:hypothetical protein